MYRGLIFMIVREVLCGMEKDYGDDPGRASSDLKLEVGRAISLHRVSPQNGRIGVETVMSLDWQFM